MKTIFLRHFYWPVCLLLIIGAATYWSLLSTDRYVSQANVVLQTPQIAPPTLSFASLMTGGGNMADMLLLRDHLLSVDMARKLDEAFDLRGHYSDRRIDRFSRLSDADLPLEKFHRHYLRRVKVEMDEYAQIMRIRASAYDPDLAQAMVIKLMREGEAHMNAMGQRLATEQVRFIEIQVADLQRRLEQARENLLAFQNRHGLVSPTGTVESLSTVVASLEAELAKLSARQMALSESQSPTSPEMVRLRSEIQAIRNQIDIERTRMAAQSGDALNRLAAEYETLLLQVEFARELYANALASLENTRVEAARTLKQVSVLQEATYPQYAMEPRRVYNITVFSILAILGALIIHMLAAIIRDHRD
ncbi:chain-length determining protein [Ectothiorhodospira shaposhnikovii]|uniref:chain-length determining protein n=1 Tax=Ectothiorhodospira shaposhnikovii TaxID=1054 RepID=UPI001EE7C4B5|nr:chain-length determining protein [Ectothiorhodospira shaposhnikovii]MCG5514237.1 chain-length determining protein [Ectothiorhodospira shaposhnikovii]